MKKILILFVLLLTISHTTVFGQESVQDTLSYDYMLAPGESAQSTIDAYTELVPALLADIDWLNNTPLSEKHDMRNEKARFVLMWISGSPTVSVRIDDRIITFQGAEPAVLFAYMMGWTKYSIEHDYSKDQIECTVAGVTDAVAFYTKNRKSLRKNKEIEKYKEMINANTLKRYVADILTK